MSKFWEQTRTIFLAMLASGGVSYGTSTVNTPKVLIADSANGSLTTKSSVQSLMSTNTVQAPATLRTPTRAEQRKIDARWGELTQKEVDALTKEFKALSKRSVVVFCANDDLCGDMALDFINAIGTAKWDFEQEAPVIDRTVGIGVSDESVATAIRRAIPRLPVAIIQSNMKDKVALVIGKKS